MDLTVLGNPELREAIRYNRVTFPAQVPTYEDLARADLQARIATLYFVLNWSLNDIGKRYNLSRERVGQIVKAWRLASLRRGYIQEIPQEILWTL